jgi:hypothetical protein
MTLSTANPLCLWSLIVAFLYVLMSTPVLAVNVGSIGVFSDTGGGDCNITDKVGVVTAEIVLVNSEGSTHVSFAVQESEGVEMVYADETVHFALKLGDTRGGIQITFGACLTGSIHLATVRYGGSGTTSACEAIRVVPHPTVGSVRIYDCEQNPYTATGGGSALVRNDGGCSCSVAAETSTWGRVKSLYR